MKLLYAWLLISYVHCNQTMVYICDSKGAIRYHYRSDCRGLSNCKHRIIRVPLNQAMESRTLCKWEQ